jgi:P-loop containing NTP hydrolase pore-1
MHRRMPPPLPTQIVLENWARGRTKHIWLSIATDLRADAQRDLKDIGCHVNVIDGCAELDKAGSKGLGLGASTRDGVLFVTYSTLISGGTRGVCVHHSDCVVAAAPHMRSSLRQATCDRTSCLTCNDGDHALLHLR